MQSSKDRIKDVVAQGLAPMFKAHGFRKSGLNFWRVAGAVTHYFNVQLSQWNRGDEGVFYLNAGVMFDELFALRGELVPPTPKYEHCQFMVRLECLDTALPAFYGVQADTPIEAFAREIASVVERVYVQPLAAVHNVKDFDALGWARAVPWSFPALIAYAVGHVEDARRLVQAEADHFADRGCTFESVAASLGLKF